MRLPLMFIEAEGILYRGPAPDLASEVWNYPRQEWTTYYSCRLHKIRGREIDEAEAERLKTENPAAEHYMYYDLPPWLGPPLSEEYRKGVMPPSAWQALLEANARKPPKLGDDRCVHSLGLQVCPTCGIPE